MAPLADFKDLAEDPHLQSCNVLTTLNDRELGTLRMPRVLPHLSRTPGRIVFAGLPMGAHNDEICRARLGLSEMEINALQAEGLI